MEPEHDQRSRPNEAWHGLTARFCVGASRKILSKLRIASTSSADFADRFRESVRVISRTLSRRAKLS